ncbi:hypothetical protein ANTPLA_LOCUS8661 [Anthophora plagiata]
MASRAASVLSSLFLSIAAATAAFSATVLLPTVQAETNALRRDLSYGPASPDFFVRYLDDREELCTLREEGRGRVKADGEGTIRVCPVKVGIGQRTS